MTDSLTFGVKIGSPALTVAKVPHSLTMGYKIGSAAILRFVIGFTPVGRQIFPRSTRRIVHINPIERKKFVFVAGKRKPGFIPTTPTTPVPVPSVALRTAFLTNTRLTQWGTNTSVPIITSVLSLVWGSNSVAQGFFQAGGQLRLYLTQPNASTQDAAWVTMFDALGTLTLFTNATLISGTGANGVLNSAIGYNQLGTSQTLYTGHITGDYAANSMTVSAVQVAGGVQFTVTLDDAYAAVIGPFTSYAYTVDLVDAGTKATIDVLYFLNNSLTPLPTGTVVSSF